MTCQIRRLADSFMAGFATANVRTVQHYTYDIRQWRPLPLAYPPPAALCRHQNAFSAFLLPILFLPWENARGSSPPPCFSRRFPQSPLQSVWVFFPFFPLSGNKIAAAHLVNIQCQKDCSRPYNEDNGPFAHSPLPHPPMSPSGEGLRRPAF